MDRVEEGQPAVLCLDGGSAGADLIVGKGDVLDGEDELGVAPVAQVGGGGEPGVEPVFAAGVDGHRALQPDIAAADLFGEEDHVAVVGDAHGHDLDLLKVLGQRDAAAEAVPGVDREAEAAFPVDDGDAGVIDPRDVGVSHAFGGEEGGLADVPVDAVVAVGDADDRAAERRRIRRMRKIVAEGHDILALVFGDARVEDAGGLIGDVLGGQHRRAAVVAVDDRAGGEFGEHFWHKQNLLSRGNAAADFHNRHWRCGTANAGMF